MEKFMEIAGRIGGQKHMVAVRDGFASTMPLIMAGAIAVMINNVFFVPWSLLANFIGAESGFIVWTNTYIAPLFSAMDAGTLSLTALGLAMALGYTRATQEDVDPLATTLVTTGAFFILGPSTRVSEVAAHITHYYGAMGIFVGLIVGLVIPGIFISIVKKGWVIKMPEMVPPSVSRAFMAIIPGAIALFAAAVVPYIFSLMATQGMGNVAADGTVTPYNLFVIIEQGLQQNLMKLFGSVDPNKPQPFLPGFIAAGAVKLLSSLLWFMGLHGNNMLTPLVNPIWGTFEQLNLQNYMNGNTANLFPWTSGSWVIYADLGGSGATLGLLIGIFAFSKRDDAKQIAKIALPSGIFEINEPVTFGLPIVLNPIYMIPFLFGSAIMSMFAFTMSYIGFAGPIVNSIPWTTPPILSAALATNFNIGAIITSIICLAISFFIYLPFVFLANKEWDKQHATN